MTVTYTPIAEGLPAVFRDDADSFAQIDSYLGLVDDLHREYIACLEELGAWLSPAASVWPPGLPLDAGAKALLGRYEELYDELAAWVGFVFPGSWPRGAAGLERRRTFLLHAARLWRRRGTPRGFIDWFCIYFGITEAAHRPWLLEHFKFGRPASDDAVGPAPWLRATLLIPAEAPIRGVDQRAEARHFVERYAPSHVAMRVCWVEPGFELPALTPYDDPDARASYREKVREQLCTLVGFTDHASALHLGECIDDGRFEDRLDSGRLPGGGSDD